MVGHPGIERGDAAHGSVEISEQFAGHTGGDLGSESPTARVFVRDEDAVSALNAFRDRGPIIGREGAEVDHFDRPRGAAFFQLRCRTVFGSHYIERKVRVLNNLRIALPDAGCFEND